MTRRQLREHVFKEIFQWEFHPTDEHERQLSLYLEELEEIAPEDQAPLMERATRIREQLPQLDERINAAAEGWKTSRMGKVDLALLRLALYEILYDEDVPVKVGINEAVEIAKKYGGDDSPAFINAVLGRLVKGM